MMLKEAGPVAFGKCIWFVLGGVAIAYCAICLALYHWQTRLIFFPTKTITVTPALYDLPYQDVWVPRLTLGGKTERVHGWWMPASNSTRATLLYFHGNGSNIGTNLERAYQLQQLGLSVLLIDYRGYGRSDGDFPSETIVYEDAQSAWSYLTQTRDIDPGDILIYGQSLGGAIAIELATHHPEAAGLIVESSFTSIEAMVNRSSWTNLFPVNWLLTQRFDSLSKVPFLKISTLYLHGTADQVVPFQMSQILYVDTPEPKQLQLFENTDHHNLAEIAGSKYLDTIQGFIRTTSAVPLAKPVD